jgi:hypothetical protein
MKWKKFLGLLAEYPFLDRDLVWRNTADDLKKFVCTKVGYIAFRPFEKLDLSAKYAEKSSPLPTKYQYVRMSSYEVTQYEISFHIEGEADGTRYRHVDGDRGDGSIQAHIDQLMEWFQNCEAFDGKQLIWERIIKRTVKGSSYAGITEMNLEIYLFPRAYRFRQILHQPLRPANPSTVAYVTGASMPPIIPGTLSAAG